MSEQEMIERANTMARAAIGKTMKVRMDRERTISGEIVEAKFARFKYTATRTSVVWQLVLKHAVTGSRHIVHVASLPR